MQVPFTGHTASASAGLASLAIPCQGCSFATQEAPMAATRTPGITIGAEGRFFIDKR